MARSRALVLNQTAQRPGPLASDCNRSARLASRSKQSVPPPIATAPQASTWPVVAGTALRVGFGMIWAVSAALTFTPDFASHDVGHPHNAATGQPAWRVVQACREAAGRRARWIGWHRLSLPQVTIAGR